MPESKNLQRLTKPEIPRKTKKCEVMQQFLYRLHGKALEEIQELLDQE